jgi:WD40 repeat protein
MAAILLLGIIFFMRTENGTVINGPEGPAAAIEVQRFVGHTTGLILGVAFLSDGKRVLSSGRHEAVRVWDLATGRQLDEFTEPSIPGCNERLDARPHLKARLWELETGKRLRAPVGYDGQLADMAFSSDRRSVLFGCSDGNIRHCEPETGRQLRLLEGHRGFVGSVAFSPDSRRALSGAEDSAMRLWDLTTGKEIRHFNVGGGVGNVMFSPDGRHGFCSAGDTVFMWDLESGRQVHTFRRHDRAVRSLALMPDGLHIISAHMAGTVRLWNIERGTEVLQFPAYRDAAYCATPSPDGRLVLTCSSVDPVVRLWQLPK